MAVLLTRTGSTEVNVEIKVCKVKVKVNKVKVNKVKAN